MPTMEIPGVPLALGKLAGRRVCVPLVVTGILWNCSFEQGKLAWR